MLHENIDLLLMTEKKTFRGSICHSVLLDVKANNRYIKSFDEN